MLVTEYAFPTAILRGLKEAFLLEGAKQSYYQLAWPWESFENKLISNLFENSSLLMQVILAIG